MFLVQEDLARARMREYTQAAEELRRINRYNTARRWQRLSVWAARRACRSFDLL